jgi:phospholipid transport system transporter-binding protein
MTGVQEQVLKLEGALTMEHAASYLAEGSRLTAGGELVVDFSGVSEFDSAALALLLNWLRVGAGSGGRLRLRAMPAGLSSLAELYGVAELLPQGEVAESV